MLKTIFKGIGIAVLIIVLFAVCFILFLTITEYRPKELEDLEIDGSGENSIAPGSSLSLLSFNIGYGALGKNQDFFMDGGNMVRPESKQIIEQNIAGIISTLKQNPADVYFIQEVDIKSKRSYYINEASEIAQSLQGASSFAYNFKCNYVPYPLPPIGKVESGLLTLTSLNTKEASRVSLPVPFKWPVSVANLKRCLLVNRVPLHNSEHELVLVNLHLEAYDDGAGKEAQTKALMDFLSVEYAKGNYVIAGGDFNQSFPNTNFERFPILNSEYWAPGILNAEMLPDGWQFASDQTTPSCRLLNQPFNGEYATTQLYVIDGYILSPNVQLNKVQTQDLHFEYSDHHPVSLHVTLSTN